MDPSTDQLDTATAVEEVLQAVEAPFIQNDTSNSGFGGPSPRQGFGIIKSQYYHILDQPKRLPFFFHPFVSKDREIDVNGTKTFFTPAFYLKDEKNVSRRFFINLDAQNLAIGAVGGLLVGLGTQQYFQTHGRFAQMSAQKWLRNPESGGATTLGKLAAGSTVTWRIMKRAAVGAILFDFLKRNADAHRDKDDWMNSFFAGGVSGAIFGLRGGLPSSIMSAAGFAVCAAIHKIMPDLDFGS